MKEKPERETNSRRFDRSMIPEEMIKHLESFSDECFWENKVKAREKLRKNETLKNHVWIGLKSVIAKIRDSTKNPWRKQKIAEMLSGYSEIPDLTESIFKLKEIAELLLVKREELNPSELAKEAYVAFKNRAKEPDTSEIIRDLNRTKLSGKTERMPEIKTAAEEYVASLKEKEIIRKGDDLLKELLGDEGIQRASHDLLAHIQVMENKGQKPKGPIK